jgi:hypothetical protein
MCQVSKELEEFHASGIESDELISTVDEFNSGVIYTDHSRTFYRPLQQASWYNVMETAFVV